MTKRKIPENVKIIIEEAKKYLIKIYGKRLKGIILYGSYARGDATNGSDIDLILLLEEMIDPVYEIDNISSEIHQLELKFNKLISIIPFDSNQYEKRRLPLILNAKKEGIII